ncbi:MAG TPA: septal ring lytic transglycosylase RlpA family protein [Terriglobales bacterium]|jgi:rare lipoprotein A|nr:septal ring lytic transglycosylase RlpA family protein [Terriglobales bacterium]
MRRSMIPILVTLFYVTSLGAAPGPNSSESRKTTGKQAKAIRPAEGKTLKRKHRPTPYQVGTASWYGKQFEGKPTATGEPYDMHEFTAAHMTLPLGTWVKVTNLRNGNWVVVRINDRGPVVPGRIIDLSYGAARMLNFKARGLTRVRLDIIHPQTLAWSEPMAGLQ